jgi:hypothetical protein
MPNFQPRPSHSKVRAEASNYWEIREFPFSPPRSQMGVVSSLPDLGVDSELGKLVCPVDGVLVEESPQREAKATRAAYRLFVVLLQQRSLFV